MGGGQPRGPRLLIDYHRLAGKKNVLTTDHIKEKEKNFTHQKRASASVGEGVGPTPLGAQETETPGKSRPPSVGRGPRS